jgi:multiple sugar transport system permease protein
MPAQAPPPDTETDRDDARGDADAPASWGARFSGGMDAVRERAPLPSAVAAHTILILGALIMVGPLVWMVLTSLKTPADAQAFFDTPRQLGAILRNLWPDPVTFDAYEAVFTERPMLRYYLNSAIYTGLRMIPSLLFASLGGFIFAKLEFPGRNWIFGAIIVTMMVPFQVKMLTLYEMMVDMRLVDTYWSVVLVRLMEPFGIFLFRQTIDGIPDDLLDAARIDGCSTLRIYWSVVLPLIRPTLAAYSIFLFMWSWSAFLWPLVVINSETLKPVEVGILGFSDINNPEFVKMMAASTVAVLPIIIFFLLMQRQFIRGVTMTGIKG